MRLKNTSGGVVNLPTIDDARVEPGGEIDVTGDDAKNLLASPLFDRTDQSSKSRSEKE